MDEQPGIFDKVKRIFRRGPDVHGDLPLLHAHPGNGDDVPRDDVPPGGDAPDAPPPPANPVTRQQPPGPASPTPQTSVFKFWRRRPDPAVANLHRAFVNLLDLTAAIKDNLDRQGHRNDELLAALSHLPRVMDLLPESSRQQSETLSAIHQQMEAQGQAQRQLAAILERMSLTGGEQRKILDAMRERMDVLNEHDQVIADNLTGFGAAMQAVSHNSQASTKVLENLKEGMTRRDGQVEKILTDQNQRYLVLIGVAVVMSLASLIATAVIAYLLYTRQPTVVTAPAPAPAAAAAPATLQPAAAAQPATPPASQP